MKSKTNRRSLDVELFEHWGGESFERSWMQKRLFDPAHAAVLREAASRFKPEKVLDVGCGSGKLLRKAREFWPQAQFSGVDPAQKMLDLARQLTPQAEFFTGSAEALTLADASVDLAFSTISFHHWRNQAAGMREVARVLRPGGAFLLADFTFPGWLTWLYSRVHSVGQMRALFEQAGLEVEAQVGPVARFVHITIGKKPA